MIYPFHTLYRDAAAYNCCTFIEDSALYQLMVRVEDRAYQIFSVKEDSPQETQLYYDPEGKSPAPVFFSKNKWLYDADLFGK